MKRGILAFVCTVFAAVTLAGCGSSSQSLSGNIQVIGSTSMEPLCSLVSEVYMEKEQGVTVSNEYVGSTAGIEALLSGTANIGTSSRNLTQKEKDQGAVENIIAKDGIAIIVNPKVTGVNALSSDQIKKIFTGAITNWKDVGGPNMPIIVIGQEAGSGTRAPFEDILGIKGQTKYANKLGSSGPVLARIADADGSIGYCSLAMVNDSVTKVSIDGVAPTKEDIQNGSYKLTKDMVMATKGPIDSQLPEVKSFFDFIYSADGQKLIEKVNLIPMPKA